jgi:hypothetical protein
MAVPRGTIFQLDPALLDGGDPTASPGTSDAASEGAGLLHESLEALEVQDEQASPPDPSDAKPEGGSTCLTCGIGGSGAAPGFASADEQRAHFKTDWHRYNIKRRLASLGAVGEQQFAALIENGADDVGSLSGSESDSGSDSGGEADEGAAEPAGGAAAGPQFAFAGAEGERLSVWRCLVAPDRERGVAPPGAPRCLSELRALREGGGRWAIVLYRGGHFAAAVYDVVPPRPGAAVKTAAAVEALFREVDHRSFHRYVVRAKAGGKQSTQDATGKFAKSAGSRLRRHNELQLQREVAEALAAWRPLLETCSLVLLAAPGSNGRGLFAGEAPPLRRADARVRRVPFTTRRPTLSEARRVARVLLTVYEPPAGAAAAEAERAAQAAADAAREAGARVQRQAAGAAAAAAAAAEAEARAAAEEAARRRRADKKAKQKARQREERQAAAAAGEREAPGPAPAPSADDEILRAAAQVAAMANRWAALAHSSPFCQAD